MQLYPITDFATISAALTEFLLQYPAENNLLLGVWQTLAALDENRLQQCFIAYLDHASEITGVVLQMPPYPLLLSFGLESRAIQLVIEHLQAQGRSMPGVSAMVTEAQQFASLWTATTGQSHELEMAMRLHQLTACQPIAPTSGYLRLATETDRTWLIEAYRTFNQEVFPERSVANATDDVDASIDLFIQQQRAYLWLDAISDSSHDSEPVSFVCAQRFSPQFARVGPVFTPLHHRRKGYATACVHTISQIQLDQGCQACFIFTDLKNPTSNHIYAKIGYCAIGDWAIYNFLEAKG
ncbi:GNAT family N-acetyltransferase [Alkalinema sp. FACHB-956]|uniref:GNAT family N-acetyltransferase n=1 Tax=Alkalinema sp. FACHB-956 TaxID=2692768 RepID=UPI00168537BA|nr:GNAT family N-acetyltransferase [Alkalinema sp. FACHB-956]MBD2328607.1 GNAT family N-acetyltransferase [Alkalinema sp. FACHB-956]